jgi:hypothetical protein
MHENKHLTLLDRLDLLDQYVNDLWNRSDVIKNQLLEAHKTYKQYSDRYQGRIF